jgi:branched-chain amino acid transport system ATP-binding protein
LRAGREWRSRAQAAVGSAAMTSTAAAIATPVLSTRGLTKTFRGLVALSNHQIDVQPREIVGIIGPNGSGKSTFFNVVTGFLPASGGTAVFAGEPILGRRPAAIARLGIARTFQGSRLFRNTTVLENIMAAAQLRHAVGLVGAVCGSAAARRSEGRIREIAAELLDLVGLAHESHRRAGDLPYGGQRRLELARALATRPRLLMLDEPAAGMDATETRELLKLIGSIRDRFDITVIVVEHDMDLIMNLCERIQVLAHGEVIFEGTPREVQADASVRDVYLGRA